MEQKQVSLNEVYKILLELKAKMNKMDQYIEDLEFARRTEEAWQEIDEGKFTEYNSPEEFLVTLKKTNAQNN
jgi:ABC-type polar amino acid transport system ATPase subunit